MRTDESTSQPFPLFTYISSLFHSSCPLYTVQYWDGREQEQKALNKDRKTLAPKQVKEEGNIELDFMKEIRWTERILCGKISLSPLTPHPSLACWSFIVITYLTVKGINSVTTLNERSTFNFVPEWYENISSSNQYYLALYMIHTCPCLTLYVCL